jgi:hypothetical protein
MHENCGATKPKNKAGKAKKFGRPPRRENATFAAGNAYVLCALAKIAVEGRQKSKSLTRVVKIGCFEGVFWNLFVNKCFSGS